MTKDELIYSIKEYIPFNEEEVNDKKALLEFINRNDDAFSRTNLVAHITSSSWILNEAHDKVLMIFHNRYQSWSWTGGHADGDTDLLHVAIKEAKEETHIKHIKPILNNNQIFSLELLTVDGHMRKGIYVPSHIHVNVTFLLEGNEHDQISPRLSENKDVKWIRIDEVTKYSCETWMNEHVYSKLNKKITNLNL